LGLQLLSVVAPIRISLPLPTLQVPVCPKLLKKGAYKRMNRRNQHQHKQQKKNRNRWWNLLRQVWREVPKWTPIAGVLIGIAGLFVNYFRK
jgi:hypothetical protein